MQQISRTMPDKQRRKYDRLLTIRQKQAIAKKGESNRQSHSGFRGALSHKHHKTVRTQQ